MKDAGYTGIKMLGIVVDELEYHYDWVEQSKEIDRSFHLDVQPEYKIDGTRGYVRLSLNYRNTPEEAGGHRIKVRFVAAYEQETPDTTVPFDAFLSVNAPAAMFAFARELIYSITSRSPSGAVLLDPTNLFGLIKHQAEARAAEQKEAIEANQLAE